MASVTVHRIVDRIDWSHALCSNGALFLSHVTLGKFLKTTLCLNLFIYKMGIIHNSTHVIGLS